MIKLAASDILPAVYRFWLECGLEDAAKLIKKKYNVENVNNIVIFLQRNVMNLID